MIFFFFGPKFYPNFFHFTCIYIVHLQLVQNVQVAIFFIRDINL